ncbi:MAG: hypothetical protein NT011_03740 [Kiritimatiellaeota bacterium]|nr:hypothetical protein [Kiritimatiellota bacterium]
MDRHNTVCQTKLFFANLIQKESAVNRLDNSSEFFKPPGIDIIAGIAGDLCPTIVDKYEFAILDHMDSNK